MSITTLVLSFVLGSQATMKGTAVSYPWTFANGNVTSRTMAATVSDEIAQKAGYSCVSMDNAMSAWKEQGLRAPSPGSWPTSSSLVSFGKATKADRILYGKVSWHTRSIWVNAGPKTISTATVTAYVFDVAKGRVVYKRSKVTGRSDERSNTLKVAAAVLLTPIVTAVSGGPATPREQRAVQIAMALAYKDWVAMSQ